MFEGFPDSPDQDPEPREDPPVWAILLAMLVAVTLISLFIKLLTLL